MYHSTARRRDRPMMDVNKNSPTPLYLQVKGQLLRKIARGEYAPHQRLPSEREISDELRISRLTVRHALDELSKDGLIYTSAGKGTFVAEPRFAQDLPQLTSFSEDMRKLGLQPSAHVLEARLVPAPPDVAARLNVEPGAEIVLVRRLHLANGQPMQLVTEYLRHDLCPGLLGHDLETFSLYDTLRQGYGLRLARADQTIEADIASDEEARLLRLTPGSPVVRLQRAIHLEDGQPISFSRAAYRGDRFTFNVVLYGQG